jgi:hypothetical protein
MAMNIRNILNNIYATRTGTTRRTTPTAAATPTTTTRRTTPTRTTSKTTRRTTITITRTTEVRYVFVIVCDSLMNLPWQ